MMTRCLLLWSLVYKIHKLVELRSDDNLSAAVTLLAQFCVVVCERVILATAAGSQTLRVYAILVLQLLHNA